MGCRLCLANAGEHLCGDEGEQCWQADSPLGHGDGDAQPFHRWAVPQPLHAAPRVLHKPGSPNASTHRVFLGREPFSEPH